MDFYPAEETDGCEQRQVINRLRSVIDNIAIKKYICSRYD